MARNWILGGLALLLPVSPAFAQGDPSSEYRMAGLALAIDQVCHILPPVERLALAASFVEAEPAMTPLPKANADAEIQGTGEAIQRMGCDHKDAIPLKQFSMQSGQTAARLWLAFGEAVAKTAEQQSWAASPLSGSSARLGKALAPYLPQDAAFVSGLREMALNNARLALAAACNRAKPGCPAAPANPKGKDAERWLKLVAAVADVAPR